MSNNTLTPRPATSPEAQPVAAGTPGRSPAPVAHTPWLRSLLLAVGAAAAVLVVLLAFLWPTVTSSVKDLPIAVAGEPAQTAQVEKQLDGSADGVFDITTTASRADAVHLIETREVYGAIVLGLSLIHI